MGSEIWILQKEFGEIVEKLFERIKQEFNPKNVHESNFLFHTHIKLRYVMFNLSIHAQRHLALLHFNV